MDETKIAISSQAKISEGTILKKIAKHVMGWFGPRKRPFWGRNVLGM